MVATVAVESAVYSIDIPYTYSLPPALAARVSPGFRVLVPFGKGNTRCEAFVLAVNESGGGAKPLKSVLALLDDSPALDDKMLRLVLWMREKFFCTFYDAFRAAAPVSISIGREKVYLPTGKQGLEQHFAGDPQYHELANILDFINQRGSARLSALDGAMAGGAAAKRADKLVAAGFLERYDKSRGIAEKTQRYIRLKNNTPLTRVSDAQRAAVAYLNTAGSAPVKEVMYFTGAARAAISALVKRGILEEYSVSENARPQPQTDGESGAADYGRLTPAQAAACDGINSLRASGKAGCALLVGVTGSGKTRVYIELIQKALKDGKTAVMLVPEIALTPQVQAHFRACFGRDVAVVHSGLTAGQRSEQWQLIKQGRARVVIGTRSAVFAPVDNLGLIIMDEEQEYTYKSENAPRYHAREVAKFRCVQHGALLVLGSATPSVESRKSAADGKYAMFTLGERYGGASLPGVVFVDMKEEMKQGNGGIISRPLRDMLADTMGAGGQAVLFLNRRGRSRLLMCLDCGYVAMCASCSASMTYHLANNRLMCHYCAASRPTPEACPDCGGQHLSYEGAGTQRVEEELARLISGARVIRMDADTTQGEAAHQKLLGDFGGKKADILVGTQMVAKGLDFENVTLSCVLDADMGLKTGDFRAGERTFSLITQLAGRAGRGKRPGTAVIQTYSPAHPILRAAAAQDYEAFYRDEIRLRQAAGMPPFCDIIGVTASCVIENEAENALMALRQDILRLKRDEYREIYLDILGPAPEPVLKVANRYRYCLTLRVKDGKETRELVSRALRTVQRTHGKRVTVTADLNPY